MACDPKHVIKDSLEKVILDQKGNTGNIIEIIFKADEISDSYINKNNVECLRGKNDYETMRNVWGFVKRNVRYKADKAGLEQVKTPGALFKIGKGDCKSFSIAIVARLRSLGYNRIYYRFTAYEPGDVSHVYVVAYTQQGQKIILDSVYDFFDAEAPYYYKKDIPARVTASISGAPGVRGSFQTGYTILILILAGVAYNYYFND
jgi:predicted transglutaminase-like cysteine proteinase